MTGPGDKKTLGFGAPAQPPRNESAPGGVAAPIVPEPPPAIAASRGTSQPPPDTDVDDAWTSPPVPAGGPQGPKGTLVVPSPFHSDSREVPPHAPRPALSRGHEPALDIAPLSVRPPPVDPGAAVDLGPPLLAPKTSPFDKHARAARELAAAAGSRASLEWNKAKTWFDSQDATRKKVVVGVGAGVLAVPVLALIIGIAVRPSRKASADFSLGSSRLSDLAAIAAAGPPVPTTEPVAPLAGPKGPCVPTGEPKQLAPKASKDVPIEIRVNADRAEIAVGFAADANTAAGVVVDLRTFETRDRFRKTAARIGRVVPVAGDQGFTFEVHAAGRAGHDQDSLIITTQSPCVLSWKKDELRLAGADGVASTSWKLEDKPSAVRALAIPTRGAAIAFRQGPSMQLAWVDQNGQPSGDLSQVQSAGTKLGAPSLAWGGSEALVAFAERESDDTPWAIRVARAGYGAAPKASRLWSAPAGGPGGPVIAPSVASLDQEGWLMMWTEGKQGQREVRMLTCDKNMEPIGEARTVSGQGNAGQGVGVVAAGHGLVAYLVGARTYELWGAGIECP